MCQESAKFATVWAPRLLAPVVPRTHGAAHQGSLGGGGRGDVPPPGPEPRQAEHRDARALRPAPAAPGRPLEQHASTAKGLREAMEEQLAELRQRHAEAAAMASEGVGHGLRGAG